MSEVNVPVVAIDAVFEHPNADRLSIVKIAGYNCVSAKREDGAPRYKAGDIVVYVPEGYVVPEWLLKRGGFWNEERNEGALGTSKKNVVKAIRLRSILSQGILFPVANGQFQLEDGAYANVNVGDNVAALLGIEKYVVPIPLNMAGLVRQVSGIMSFDFEDIKRVPVLFNADDEVWVSEKIHGTFSIIGMDTTLNEDELLNSNLYASSKGMAKQGLAFKDRNLTNSLEDGPCNLGNLYQQNLRSLVKDGLVEWMEAIRAAHNAHKVQLFGEIYGAGVQDLHYGAKQPEFRLFDIAVDGNFLPYNEFTRALTYSPPMKQVPVLYHGPYDEDAIVKLRDGKTVVGGDNIREGVVVRDVNNGWSQEFCRRKIAKFVSPDYLLRKSKNGDVTEFE